jgi:hypothetical protein
MDTTKVILATIGAAAIIAASCFTIGLMVSNDERPSEDWASDASSDGLTYSQIQSKLNRYADIINSKDASIIISGDVWSRYSGSSWITDTSGNTIKPIAGSAKVVDGDLAITTTLRSNITNGTYSTSDYELIIPYHSIVAIKVGSV